jgi:hypothetical protein
MRRLRCLLLLVAAAAPATAVPASAATAPGFGTPTVVSNFHPGFEPDVAVDTSPTAGNGQIYTSTPFGFSTTQSFIFRSNDGGRSFHLAEGNFLGKPATCIGGGDTELQPDPVSGAVYFSDLQGLTNFSNSVSSDAGRTWQTSCSAVNGAGVDRQWIGVDTNGHTTPVGAGDQLGRLYEDYDNVQQDTNQDNELGNQLVMNESLDGVHYGSNCVTAGLPCLGPPAVISRDEGIPGNVVVDDNPGSPNLHTVYAVHTSSSNHSVAVSYCRGKGGDKTAAQVANDCSDPSQFAPGDPGHVNVNWKESLPRKSGQYLTGTLFASMAIDTAGNLYVTWAEYPADKNDHPSGPGVVKLAISTDGAKSWQGPFDVSPPELGNNVMPWVTAGSPGRVGIAWYGAQAAQEKSSYGPDTLDHGSWNVFYAQSVDALQSGLPTFDITRVTDHQTKFGNISTQGLGGSPDRSLGDFMQVRLGPDGGALISYVDDTSADRNPDYCQGCGQTPSEAAGPIMVARQTSGTSLLAGKPDISAGPDAFGSVTDPTGTGYPDAFYSSNGTDTKATPNLDVAGAQVTDADASHLAITLRTADPNLAKDLSGDPSLGGGVGEWIVRWAAPPYTAQGDGNIFYVGMQAGGDGAPQFYGGTTCAIGTTHTKYFTFPTQHAVPGSISGGTIRWTVPLSDVGKPAKGQGLYGITGFTATQVTPSNAANNGCSDTLTGSGADNIPNLIDATPPFSYAVGGRPANTGDLLTGVGVAPGASRSLCTARTGFTSARVDRRGHGLRISFRRRISRPVSVDVFQESSGRNVLGNRRVAHFARRTRSFTWNGHANRRGRHVTNGVYFVRLRMALGRGVNDDRRYPVSRRAGHFATRPAFYRRTSCAAISSFKLENPVFGGVHNRPVGISFRLATNARVAVAVLRGNRVVKRYAAATRRRNRTYRLRLAAERLRRAEYHVRLTVSVGGRTVVERLTARRL